MKKLFLILPIILMSCAEFSQISAPPEKIRNDKCAEIQKYKVFQVFDAGALAFACEEKSYTDCAYGLTVFVPKQKSMELYDDQIIKPTDGQCIVYDGIYKYTTKMDNNNKTVPKLKMADSRISNPAYTEWSKGADNGL